MTDSTAKDDTSCTDIQKQSGAQCAPVLQSNMKNDNSCADIQK